MRDKILSFFKFLVSSLLLYYLLRKIGVHSILEEFRNVTASWLVLAIVIFTLSNLLGALQWHLLLHNVGVSLKYSQVLRYYYVGLFFNSIFISNMGGDVFRLFYISRHQNNGPAAFSSVFLDRFLGFSMLIVLALVGGFYRLGTSGWAKVWPILVTLALCWLFGVLLFFNRKFAYLMHLLLRWFLPEKLLIKLKDIYTLINKFTRSKLLVISLVGISLVIQFIRIMIHYLAGKAVGVEVHFTSFLIFIPMIALLASIPISIGGLGVREQSGVFLFQKVGVSMALAASMEFLADLLTIGASLPGMIFFIFIAKTRRNHASD